MQTFQMFQAAYIVSWADVTFHLRFHGGAFVNSLKLFLGKENSVLHDTSFTKHSFGVFSGRQYHIFIHKYEQDSAFQQALP